MPQRVASRVGVWIRYWGVISATYGGLGRWRLARHSRHSGGVSMRKGGTSWKCLGALEEE